jgi:hypothetical protein
VALHSGTHLKPQERFFVRNCQFYRIDRFPERKGIPHNHVDLYYMCDTFTGQKRSLYVRDKPSLSSEMLRKDYDPKGSLTEISAVVRLKGVGTKMNLLAVNRRRKITVTLNELVVGQSPAD